LWTR